MSDVPLLTLMPPELAPQHVHIIAVASDGMSLSAENIASLESFLSTDEKQKIARLRVDSKRIEAILSRGLLRLVLAHFLHISPRRVALIINSQGKPLLGSSLLHFNISHTAGLVLLAVTRDHEIGIDVEFIHDLPLEDLAERFFTAAEHAALMALPVAQRRRAFFRCWTRKESILKATGLGITAGLNTFEVPLHDSSVPLVVKEWTLRDVKVPGGYMASLAAAADSQLCYWSYRMGSVQPD